MNQLPTFSVVIATYGRPVKLKRCLEGIGRIAYPRDQLEVIVVDDGSPVEVRRAIGDQTVLFGNIEASEIELLSEGAFEARVRQSLEEGTAGEGRGFVLMPSSCPYGREIAPRVMANYETMVRLAKAG